MEEYDLSQLPNKGTTTSLVWKDLTLFSPDKRVGTLLLHVI
jgi:hypothetical protein